METDFGSPGMLITCYTALGDGEGARRAAQITLDRAEKALAQDRSNGSAMGFGGQRPGGPWARPNGPRTGSTAPC